MMSNSTVWHGMRGVALLCARAAAPAVQAAYDPAVVERSEYLAQGIAGCGNCHTPRDADGALIDDMELAGAFVIEEPAFAPDFTRTGAGGNVYRQPFGFDFATVSSNVTPHPELGIGRWTDAEIKRAITEGVSRDDRQLLPFMVFAFYKNIANSDLDALIAYLRSLPVSPREGQ